MPDAPRDAELAQDEFMTGESHAARKRNGALSSWGGVLLFVAFFSAAIFLTYRTLTTASPPKPYAPPRIVMCAETGKTFEYTLKEGETWPVDSPFTNRKTAYPCEACYWTRDGKRKSTPTYVILNSAMDKPGDTVCPDCGRLVVVHNPRPPQDAPLVDAPTASAPAASGK